MADHPFGDITGMLPVATVGAGVQTVHLTGLDAWRDHYFVVVPVDLLGGFDRNLTYAANYILSGDLVTREYGLHNGGGAASPVHDIVGREVGMIVPDAAVPAPVTGLGSGFDAETSVVAYKAVDLVWPDYNEIAQTDVVAYRVYVGLAYFEDVSAMSPYERTGADTNGCTVGGLESNEIYYFAVVAEDIGGRHDPAVRSVSALTSAGGVSAVQDLAVEGGADSLTYTWTPPAEGMSFLNYYRVFFDGAADPVILPSSAVTYVAGGLPPSHGYSFRIVGVDIFGNEAGSSSVFGATWLSNPVVGHKELDGAVRLSWSAVEPGDLLQEYAVFQSDAAFTDVSGMAPVIATGQTRTLVSGLANEATYYFAVVAVNVPGSFSPTVDSLGAVPQPDVQGAMVVAAVPAGPSAAGGGVEQVLQAFRVTFDDIMDPDSFTSEDVRVTAPGRGEVEVRAISALSETEFLVTVADAVAAGAYTIQIGPDILDECGNQMDQNGNGTNGEEDDAYTFTIELTDPGLAVGTGDGLLAEYFEEAATSGTSRRQRDAAVDHDWDTAPPVAGMPADQFSVVWTGELEARFDSDYTFVLEAEGGASLWLDDALVLDGWTGSRRELVSEPIPLTRGRRSLQVAFADRGGSASVSLGWSCAFFPKTAVPQTQLYSGLEYENFAETPTVSPSGGTVTSASDVALACATEGAELYYALATADPDVLDDWRLYDDASPIHLSANATLCAFARRGGRNRSGVRVCVFELQQTELCGTVWSDLDRDGTQNGTEPGLANRLFFLDGNGDGRWPPGEVSAHSGADGTYCLRTPWGGTHPLRLSLGQEERLSVPVADYEVATVAGQHVTGLDFGLIDGVPPNASFDRVLANAMPVQFTGTTDDPTAIIELRFNGTAILATNAGDGTWHGGTAGFGTVAEGCHDAEILVEDPAGNSRTVAVADAVCIRSAAPTVAGVSPVLVEGRALARVEVTFDSAVGAATLQPGDLLLSPSGLRDGVVPDLVRLDGGGLVVVAQFPPQTANGG